MLRIAQSNSFSHTEERHKNALHIHRMLKIEQVATIIQNGEQAGQKLDNSTRLVYRSSLAFKIVHVSFEEKFVSALGFDFHGFLPCDQLIKHGVC